MARERNNVYDNECTKKHKNTCNIAPQTRAAQEKLATTQTVDEPYKSMTE